MGKTTPDQEQMAEVVAWLRTPDGEQWSHQHSAGVSHRDETHGVFAEIKPDALNGATKAARWPAPAKNWQLPKERLR